MRTFLIITLVVILTAMFAPGALASVLGGLIALTVSGLIALLIVGAVMLLVGLIFGSTMLALIAGAVALAVVGFSVFWPLILVFFVVWLCVRDNKPSTA
ncbi:hypothetical protein [Aliidiomarina maris]|uniref:Phage shock protein G n=1 Tax=Aliidiomarina maris TaxID=531312 RepID=A0A327WMT6_9GAMM|nr:hypothetical protein [Aliidiomarina maris]RAJ92895.1 hypothetical protein B0I24_1271 [Aliidiomarina maris]RUO18112.1 hypothetical protein CWE07_14185 [Aliidiomarina maris]